MGIHEDTETALYWISTMYIFMEQYCLDNGSMQLAWLHTFLPRHEDEQWKKEMAKAGPNDLEARLARLAEPATVGVESAYVKELAAFKKLSQELSREAK